MKLWLRGAWRAAAAVSVGFALLFAVVSMTPLVHWWATALAGPWAPATGQVLIVLGGSMRDYGTLGGSSYWRAVYAAQAWHEGGFRSVMVSGGDQDGGNVSEAMRDFLVCQGVPPGVIRLESKSGNTYENAVNTAHLLAAERGQKVLLTSDYHMFRAVRAFEKAGLTVTPRPYPDVRKRATQWRGRWPAFLDLVEETAKIAYYYANGWI